MMTARLDGQVILLNLPQWDDQEDALRQAARERRLTAPCCGHPVLLKWGVRKVRHFAHWPRVSCPYERWSEPESAEHIAGKLLLYTWCQRHVGTRLTRVELEYPLREIYQRPDLYLELDDGTAMAIEYQRSAISLKEWTERHQGYQRLGIADIWIFGENRLHEALPSSEQAERWSRQEPRMQFLGLRAFENAAAARTPYEIAWWRIAEQEEIWGELELAARTGREVSPWYQRRALERLRSITFLDAATGILQIFRGMRELRGHVDTRMVSHQIQISLDQPGLTLTEQGFVTAEDREQLARHEARVRAVEAAYAKAPPADHVAEQPAAYESPAPALDPRLPAWFHQQAERRRRLAQRFEIDPRPFLLEEQEAEQRRWLEQRARLAEWRNLVDRLGLRPENLFYLVGVPIPDDTVIPVHRTAWQSFLYYRLVRGRNRGSFSVRWVRGHLERRFGLDPAMVRAATLLLPGRVNGPDEVIGTFLNLLAAGGYLRNDWQNEHFRYHRPTAPPPTLAFMNRQERHLAWGGLLAGTLTLQGSALVGEGHRIQLLPVK